MQEWFAEEGIKSDLIPLQSIKPGNAKWGKFKKYCADHWKVYLEPSSYDLKEIEAEKKHYLSWLEEQDLKTRAPEMTEEEERHYFETYV